MTYNEAYQDRIEDKARDMVDIARAIAEQDGVSVEAAALCLVTAALIELDESVDGLS